VPSAQISLTNLLVVRELRDYGLDSVAAADGSTSQLRHLGAGASNAKNVR
jgi:hypothetical protein